MRPFNTGRRMPQWHAPMCNPERRATGPLRRRGNTVTTSPKAGTSELRGEFEEVGFQFDGEGNAYEVSRTVSYGEWGKREITATEVHDG